MCSGTLRSRGQHTCGVETDDRTWNGRWSERTYHSARCTERRVGKRTRRRPWAESLQWLLTSSPFPLLFSIVLLVTQSPAMQLSGKHILKNGISGIQRNSINIFFLFVVTPIRVSPHDPDALRMLADEATPPFCNQWLHKFDGDATVSLANSCGHQKPNGFYNL